MLLVGWHGGQAAVGVSLESPAALMDRPMMSPTHQGQSGQIGRAALQPMPQMMGLTPAQRPSTAGTTQPPSRTARARRWATMTTRLVRPTSSGWVGGPPRVGGAGPSPPGFQGPASQLSQGVGAALAATAAIGGIGRPSQRRQRRQQGMAGLGLQQPVHRHHAFPAGGQPQPPLPMTPLGLLPGPLGIGDQPQVAHDAPQPGRVQPPGRLQRDRFGLGGNMAGEVLDSLGERAGMGHRQLPVGHAWAVAAKGPRTSARAVRTQLAAVPAPMCSRLRRQLAVEGAGVPWSAPAAPRASTVASSLRWLGRSGWPDPSAQRARPPLRSGARPLVWPLACSNMCSTSWRQPISPSPEGQHHHTTWG
jgi:hypothetical protein